MRKNIILGVLMGIACVSTVHALTSIITINNNDEVGNQGSTGRFMTPDARFVLFDTMSDNIDVADQGDFRNDVYMRDTVSGTTVLVSKNSSGEVGDWESYGAGISDNGRYVLFNSYASNLVPNDTNGYDEVFVKDMQTDTIMRVAASDALGEGNSSSYGWRITPDGRYVFFSSYATNLVNPSTMGPYHLYKKDLITNDLILISQNMSGDSSDGDIFFNDATPDGRYVVFNTLATNLVANDTNGMNDVFVADTVSGGLQRISVGLSGAETNGDSYGFQISSDGRYVVFQSYASNLVANDTNGIADIFVRDILTNTTSLVNITNMGVQDNGGSNIKDMTPDGRYILFSTDGNTFTINDFNGFPDIYLKDMQTGLLHLVSATSNGDFGDAQSNPIGLSDDGRYVFFDSYASNLVTDDTNYQYDVFIKDMDTNTITRVSVDSVGNQINGYSEGLAMTPNGQYIIFYTDDGSLYPGDTNWNNDIFLNEWQIVLGGAPTIVSPIDGSYRNTTGDIVVVGVGLSGATVRVMFLGNQFLTTVDSNNEWSIVLPWQLDGVYSIYAQQRGEGEVLWGVTGVSTFTIDTIKPGVPTILTPVENTLISGGNMYVVGQGEVGGTVVVRVGNQKREGVIDGLGNWVVGPFAVVPGYKYAIVAKQKDLAENESDWSAPRTIYGAIAGTSSINENDYMPDLILYKRGLTQVNSDTNVNPQDDIRYTLDYVNAGKAYGTGVMIEETIPENTCFTIGSISGLNADYIVEYSNNKGQTYSYVPVGGIGDEDCNVTDFRARMLVPYAAKNNAVVDAGNGTLQNLQQNNGLRLYSGPIISRLTGLSADSPFNVVADFNGDMIDDVVIGSFRYPSWSLLTDYIVRGQEGTYQPSFEALQDSSSYPASETHGVFVGNFNGDGYKDVLLINGDTYYGTNADDWIYYGSASGFIKMVLTGSSGNGENAVVADFNQDGYDDAILMNGSNFGDRGNSKMMLGGTTGVSMQILNNIRGFLRSYTTGYINADIYPDAVISRVNYQDEIIVYGGATGFAIQFLTGSAGSTWNIPKIDINQDGYEDIIFSNDPSPSKVMFGLATGGYTLPVNLTGVGHMSDIFIDYNADGVKDIVTIAGGLGVMLGETGVSYMGKSIIPITFPGGGVIPNTYSWTQSDLNDDGFKDIILAPGASYPNSNVLVIYAGATVTKEFLPLSINVRKMIGGDFNGDGVGDVFTNPIAGFGNQHAHIIYGNVVKTGSYTTVLSSVGNISHWSTLFLQEDIINGNNSITYTVFAAPGGICNTGSVLVGPVISSNNTIDISSISGAQTNICVKADFTVLTGSISPIINSIMAVWDNDTVDSFTFDVQVKSGNFSGTTVRNVARIRTLTNELNTGNNSDMHEFVGLPSPIMTGFGGGGGGVSNIGGGGDGKGKGLTKVETLQEKAEKIKEIDIEKPEVPVVVKPERVRVEDIKVNTNGEVVVAMPLTTPEQAITNAIIKTSYVGVGSVVEVKTIENPVLKSEKRCYTPQEAVEITLGVNTNKRDLLVYQALLKSYDLTMFTDTDKYMPENGLKRHEAAKMLVNFARHILCRDSIREYTEGVYTDIANVDPTLVPYIKLAYEYGILQGAQGKFRPLDKITRKEFVAALIRMFTKQNMDVYGRGNDWDIEYRKAFAEYGLDKIVGEYEDIDRYSMSKILYKLYYEPTYEWTAEGYVLPYTQE